jgi:hypothetical protein
MLASMSTHLGRCCSFPPAFRTIETWPQMAYAPIAAQIVKIAFLAVSNSYLEAWFGCPEQLPGGLVVCSRAFTGSEHACEYFYAVGEVLLVSTGV